jgi:hypothetical protein
LSQVSSSFLRGYAIQTLSESWKADILRDFKNEIEYIDGDKHGKKRPYFDKQNFYDQIDFYAESFVDEWLLAVNKEGVTNAQEFKNNFNKVNKIHHKLMSRYRKKMARYAKSKRTI